MKWLQGDFTTIKELLEIERTKDDPQTKKTADAVAAIIQAVRYEGDDALRAYTKSFDNQDILDFRVSSEAITEALSSCDPELLKSLTTAKQNIESFHKQQLANGFVDTEKAGVVRGQLYRPIETVGIYVPGGTAAYPSSVLMNAIPAKIAGVSRIVMVTPPSEAGIPSTILAAAALAGVDEVYKIGGAQAIAALAYGTESIPKVDKIVGPGNRFVAAAKRAVFGEVGIDMIAGPSEIVVAADETANPAFIAADLLSQAEHDPEAAAILITTSQTIAEQTEKAVTDQLQTLARRAIAEQALQDHGKIIVAASTADLFEIVNLLAPEHLEIQLESPFSYLHAVKHAGSIFLGNYASEPLGDYVAGPNHVLPTSGTARFSSPLSVYDFQKRMSFVSYTKEALAAEKDAIIRIAESEGLQAHARAIQIRYKEEF
ncbi:Histidinol dehydrogenase [Listeria grayi]|uniref:Histidinol dehydrogenase n=1 Tax=Listeria grayi FSL F6-1183 TaxID=1265827 RepID=A0A829R2M5_LISGR|nr:histidinol dehydrogenase [Listeria grayi]EUJ26240.1 bifunctional histidinal dehydrogenase/ histidinol dehydrogenase [Listeria grayi FSL F6-1183]VEI32176.1 Histidinol dehydrogenase [Listeria grayi]